MNLATTLRPVKGHITAGEKSHVGNFMRKHFPLAHDFYRANTLHLQKCKLIEPPSAPYPYAIVGSAFENKIHLALGKLPPDFAQRSRDKRLEEELGKLTKATYEAVLEDLNLLTRLFFRQCSDWLKLPYIAKPRFSSSALIGGEGDLILGETLVDIKVTKNSWFSYKYLHQLMLYVLLSDLKGDFIRNDLEIVQSPIRKIGIYFARHGELLTWTVGEILDIFKAPSRRDLTTELLEILIADYKERNSFETNTPLNWISLQWTKLRGLLGI